MKICGQGALDADNLAVHLLGHAASLCTCLMLLLRCAPVLYYCYAMLQLCCTPSWCCYCTLDPLDAPVLCACWWCGCAVHSHGPAIPLCPCLVPLLYCANFIAVHPHGAACPRYTCLVLLLYTCDVLQLCCAPSWCCYRTPHLLDASVLVNDGAAVVCVPSRCR